MIIPIRCFTCNKVLGSIYNKYNELINLKKLNNNINDVDSIYNIDSLSIENSNIDIFKQLNIKRYCCRRMFLTQVDIVDVI